ncbi:hypothetical protein DFH29DRAFT_984383 [Suillus ampliporus]|nr:hypothetical protein DFH29DRAFT_984383 [Suillus ampliporus]
MRLFELSKLSLSSTGVCLLQITHSLCQQIGKNAINHYNIQAKISWKDITDYSFLGKFDLLHHSHTDIQNNDWAAPAHQEATTKFFKLCQAHEEITQLNVEVCHLCTAIHNEELHTSTVIQDLLVSNPQLGNELQDQWRPCMAINTEENDSLMQDMADYLQSLND